ncbi:type II secretion system protein [Candidatus Uhrbacteria bacterium]|nr:type II secretion system protein [Candidatus Uhrbacteria bacterium]
MKRGFTLLEVLIVVSIIAILGAASALGVSAARSKMRDARRLSDMRQLQSALEDYYKEFNQYPTGEGLWLGEEGKSACLSSAGFSASCQGASRVFLSRVSREYTAGISSAVRCGVPPAAGYCYTAKEGGASYRVGFELEHGFAEANISEGPNCLIPEVGIRSGACPE